MRHLIHEALTTPSPAPTVAPTAAPTNIIDALYNAQSNATVVSGVDGTWLSIDLGNLLGRYNLEDRRRLLDDLVLYAPAGIDWIRVEGSQFPRRGRPTGAEYIAISTKQSLDFEFSMLRGGYQLYHPLAVANSSPTITCKSQTALHCERNGTQLVANGQNVTQRTNYDLSCGGRSYRLYVAGASRLFAFHRNSNHTVIGILIAIAIALELAVAIACYHYCCVPINAGL